MEPDRCRRWRRKNRHKPYLCYSEWATQTEKMKEREGGFPALGAMHMERSQWANVEHFLSFFFYKKEKAKGIQNLGSVLFGENKTGKSS